jgi:hypothetical protein
VEPRLCGFTSPTKRQRKEMAARGRGAMSCWLARDRSLRDRFWFDILARADQNKPLDRPKSEALGR